MHMAGNLKKGFSCKKKIIYDLTSVVIVVLIALHIPCKFGGGGDVHFFFFFMYIKQKVMVQ